MSGKRLGYIRVSTSDQNPDRQLEGIQVDKKFIDYASAISLNREQLKAIIDYVRDGDIVIVHSMDRLARNVSDLRRLVDLFLSKKVEVRFIKENLIFNGQDNALSNMLLSVMGAFAEFEHAFIRERQREGIAIAKRKGIHLGRKKILDAKKIEIMKKEFSTGKSKVQIAEEMGVSLASIYRYLK